MSSFAIIIPCYNEEKRLNIPAFKQFAQLPAAKVFFVNDSSTDKTIDVINDIVLQNGNVEVINLSKNMGKGEAVRQGIIYALKTQPFDYIGYLDADLSTPVEEYHELYKYLKDQNADFIFGSRIKKLGSAIERPVFRHIIGRIIATILDKKFQLGYYDTQCGAKVFKSSLLEKIIRQTF
jgi:glycosyltransferase involved in cell wall biosynthesis